MRLLQGPVELSSPGANVIGANNAPDAQRWARLCDGKLAAIRRTHLDQLQLARSRNARVGHAADELADPCRRRRRTASRIASAIAMLDEPPADEQPPSPVGTSTRSARDRRRSARSTGWRRNSDPPGPGTGDCTRGAERERCARRPGLRIRRRPRRRRRARRGSAPVARTTVRFRCLDTTCRADNPRSTRTPASSSECAGHPVQKCTAGRCSSPCSNRYRRPRRRPPPNAR